MKKRLLAMVLTVAMCLMVVPATAISVMAAATQPGYTTSATKLFKTDSKTKEITLAKGIKAKSTAKLTRTHIAAILTKVMNAGAKATSYKATNVTTANKDVIEKAIAMGIFSKTSAFSSTKKATRQEAVASLLKVFQAKGSNFETLESVSDANKVPKATKALFAYFANKEIIDISDDAFNPTGSITVGEFMKMVDDLAGNVITKKGTYTKLGNGNVTIATKDVVLSKVNVKKNLTIADGVGTGDVTLKDTKVTGRTVVRGGGSNSIKILGKSVVKDLVIECVNSNVRIFADGNQVKTITVNDGKSDVIIEAAVENLTINTDTPVEIKADIKAVTVAAKNAEVTVAKDVKVETVNVEKTASGTSVDVKGTVATITTEAPKSEIKGDGTVTNVEVKADDTKIDTIGSKVTVGDDVKGTTANGTDVAGGSSGTTTDKGVVPETPPIVPPVDPPYNPGPSNPTINVKTIDELFNAIDSATSGTIINLATGDYELTKPIVINKSLTLRGTTGTKFIKTSDYTSPTNAMLQVGGTNTNLDISNIVFDGGNNLGGAICIETTTRASTSVTVSSCTFEKATTGVYINNGMKLVAKNNIFADSLNVGIGTDCKASNLTITGNTFTGLTEAVGFTALNDTDVNFNKFKAYVIANNTGATDDDVENNITSNVKSHGDPIIEVSTVDGLEAALSNAKHTILVNGVLGSASGYANYTVDKAITILGAQGNKLYGSFIVNKAADGVVFDGLNIEHQYIGDNGATKNAINAHCSKMTVTNCSFTPASPLEPNYEPNGIVIFPSEASVNYVINNNTFTDYNVVSSVNENDKIYQSTGILIAEEYPMANKTFFNVSGNSATLSSFDDGTLTTNIYNNCGYGYVRQGDFSWNTNPIGFDVRYAVVFTADALQNANKLAKDGATIVMGTGTYALDSQIRITRPITLIGAGVTTLKPSTKWSSEILDGGCAAIVVVSSVNGQVTLQDFTATASKDITIGVDKKAYGNGITIVNSQNVALNNITSTNNAGAGLIVSSSTVTATNLKTSGNAWYGVNVEVVTFSPQTPSRLTLVGDPLTERIITDVFSSTDLTNVEGYIAVPAQEDKYENRVVWEKVSKVALTNAINAANADKGATRISTDGSDVWIAEKWVTQAEADAYDLAIAAAQTVADKADARQVEIDVAVTDLAEATGAFTTAKSDGTQDKPL